MKFSNVCLEGKFFHPLKAKPVKDSNLPEKLQKSNPIHRYLFTSRDWLRKNYTGPKIYY